MKIAERFILKGFNEMVGEFLGVRRMIENNLSLEHIEM